MDLMEYQAKELFAKHDVPVTLVITTALWLMARCWPDAPGRAMPRGSLLLPALATGMAWSMHYYAVFLGIPLVLTAWMAHADAPVSRRVRRAAVASRSNGTDLAGRGASRHHAAASAVDLSRRSMVP